MYDPQIIGLGSMVPRILHVKGTSSGEDGIKHIFNAIKIVRNEFPDAFMHVFGIGGSTSLASIFSLGVDSVDSMAYRMKAVYGRIQFPNISDRGFVKNGYRTMINKSDTNLFDNCKCPICSKNDVEAVYEIYKKSFKLRAVHNAWVHYNEGNQIREAINEDRIKDIIKTGNSNLIISNACKKHLVGL